MTWTRCWSTEPRCSRTGEIDTELGVLLQSTHREAKLGAAGVRVQPLQMESVGRRHPLPGGADGHRVVLVLVLFMLILGQVMMVAMGVVEEKGSRIVEILLAAVRPWQLLGGKIIGLGVLGLINLVTIVVVGSAAPSPPGSPPTSRRGWPASWSGVLVWFVLGYAFFATLARRARLAGLAAGGGRQRDVAADHGHDGGLLRGVLRDPETHRDRSGRHGRVVHPAVLLDGDAGADRGGTDAPLGGAAWPAG